MKELLRAIKNRLTLVKEFDGVPISVQATARFDDLVEGKPEVIISPATVLYDYDTRDTIKETTTVSVSLAVYFADNFDEGFANDLLALAPTIEAAFLGVDLPTRDGSLYRWQEGNTLATPFNNVIKDIPGGVLDANAADQAYTFQVPVLLTYARFLKMIQLPSVTLRDLPSGTVAFKIYAPDDMRLSLNVFDSEGDDVTTWLYQMKALKFG